MLKAVAHNGRAVIAADGDIGVSVMPDGQYLVMLLDSLLAMSDWTPYSGPMLRVPQAALDEIAAMKRGEQP